MSSSADKPSITATAPPLDGRRRRDAHASRQALLEAADALFDERGYDGATVREIGERAGVDAALIARYFGSKEGLYLATLQQEGRLEMPTDPVQAFAMMLTKSERRGTGPVPLAMVSPTLTEGIRDQVREIIGRRVVEPLAGELAARGTPDAELRVEVLVAMALGLSLTRAGGTLPTLAETPLQDLLAVLEPLIDALQAPAAA
jgi:AcrR family transcriptional regulator